MWACIHKRFRCCLTYQLIKKQPITPIFVESCLTFYMWGPFYAFELVLYLYVINSRILELELHCCNFFISKNLFPFIWKCIQQPVFTVTFSSYCLLNVLLVQFVNISTKLGSDGTQMIFIGICFLMASEDPLKSTIWRLTPHLFTLHFNSWSYICVWCCQPSFVS